MALARAAAIFTCAGTSLLSIVKQGAGAGSHVNLRVKNINGELTSKIVRESPSSQGERPSSPTKPRFWSDHELLLLVFAEEMGRSRRGFGVDAIDIISRGVGDYLS